MGISFYNNSSNNHLCDFVAQPEQIVQPEQIYMTPTLNQLIQALCIFSAIYCN